MGTIVFWVIFVALVVILFFNNYNRAKSQRQQRDEQIQSSFGKKIDSSQVAVTSHDAVCGYQDFVRRTNSESSFNIDDITYNDLNLDAIYGIMNTTYSSAGEEVLYSKLRTISLDGKEPLNFYNNMQKFIGDSKVRIQVQQSLDKLGKIKGISSFTILEHLFSAQCAKVQKDIVTDILLVCAFAFIFIIPSVGMLAFLALLIISISSYFSQKALMDNNLKAYCYCVRLVECASGIQSIVNDSDFTIDNRLRNLTKYKFLIPSKDGTTSNPFTIIFDYIRMIFHVDLIAYNKRLATIVQNKEEIISIYEYIGTIDAQIAVASYATSVNSYCQAELVSDSGFKAKGMYHPLTKTIVTNDISTDGGVLVTGSNASGKSTFLKMVGINVIFAQSFGFALADKLIMAPFKLYTSMALSDNILGEESYYIVETRSLKRICDATRESDNVLCIIDEVLRGTNTSERIAASCRILKYIRDNKAICFVATHDGELTELLKSRYELYYFTEEIVDGNVTFPYKIHEGVSEAGNAIKLLEVMDFDKSIVDGAVKIVNNHQKTGKWEDN